MPNLRNQIAPSARRPVEVLHAIEAFGPDAGDVPDAEIGMQCQSSKAVGRSHFRLTAAAEPETHSPLLIQMTGFSPTGRHPLPRANSSDHNRGAAIVSLTSSPRAARQRAQEGAVEMLYLAA